MSDFLQNPSFQPNEEFKNLIDSLFQEEKKVKKTKEAHDHTFQLNLPDAPPLEESEQKLVLKIAREELEQFRIAFLDFQDKVSDMAIYSYLYPGLEVFGEECSDLRDLIEDDFAMEGLSEAGLEDYEEVLKVRRRIFASIFDKYKNNH